MFETILIRRHDNSDRIDVGALAETLLFYGKVHLILDPGSLRELLRTVGADNLIHLLRDKRAHATILTDMLAAHTTTPLVGKPFYDFGAISLVQRADGRKYKRKDVVGDAFSEVLGNNKLARAKAERFLKYTKLSQHNEASVAVHDTIPGHAREDLSDADYVRFAVESTLRDSIPNARLPMDWRYTIEKRSDGSFSISTNLNFDELNKDPQSNNSISEAHLALSVLEARADLDLSARYMSEIVTSPSRAKIIQRRFDQLFLRREMSEESISTFQELALDNSRAIREVINSGERSFDDFLRILNAADKFKAWIAGLNPDAKLINEYYAEATRETWINSLPGKITRFAICTIGGELLDFFQPTAQGKILGASFGAADAIWADRILGGWRPSHFINGRLKSFIES